MSVSESQAHYEGEVAYEQQRMLADNPYEDVNAPEHQEWAAGWFAAHAEFTREHDA